MSDATRPFDDALAPESARIIRLVEEWEALSDPADRRLLLAALGGEDIRR